MSDLLRAIREAQWLTVDELTIICPTLVTEVWTKYVIRARKGRNIDIIISLHHKLLLSKVLSKDLIVVLVRLSILDVSDSLLINLRELIQIDVSPIKEAIRVTIRRLLITQI